jgi:hypothetical protein
MPGAAKEAVPTQLLRAPSHPGQIGSACDQAPNALMKPPIFLS